MGACGVARRPTVRPSGLVVRMGLVLLVALAGLPMLRRLWVPPAVRTIAVGRVPMAVVVDVRTQRVFVANMGSTTVSKLDATGGAVLATVMVAPHSSTPALATTAGRVSYLWSMRMWRVAR